MQGLVMLGNMLSSFLIEHLFLYSQEPGLFPLSIGFKKERGTMDNF